MLLHHAKCLEYKQKFIGDELVGVIDVIADYVKLSYCKERVGSSSEFNTPPNNLCQRYGYTTVERRNHDQNRKAPIVSCNHVCIVWMLCNETSKSLLVKGDSDIGNWKKIPISAG